MTDDQLILALRIAGVGHFGILIASALVPFRLDWKRELASLSKLHWQMYWVYGGYVVLSIIAFGVITLLNARELASGSLLAKCFCGYVAIFWGVRFSLQWVFDVKAFLNVWWIKMGYHTLTVMFGYFTLLYWYVMAR